MKNSIAPSAAAAANSSKMRLFAVDYPIILQRICQEKMRSMASISRLFLFIFFHTGAERAV